MAIKTYPRGAVKPMLDLTYMQDDELSTPQSHPQEHSLHWVRLNPEKADIMLQRLNAKFTVQGLSQWSSG